MLFLILNIIMGGLESSLCSYIFGYSSTGGEGDDRKGSKAQDEVPSFYSGIKILLRTKVSLPYLKKHIQLNC